MPDPPRPDGVAEALRRRAPRLTVGAVLLLFAAAFWVYLDIQVWLAVARVVRSGGLATLTSFRTIYAAAELVRAGHGAQLYNIASLGALEQRIGRPETVAYLNPPFFAAMLTPLVSLSFARAYQLWAGIGMACVGVTGWLLWRALGSHSAVFRGITIGLLVLSVPVAGQTQLGQFSAILLLAWTAGFLALRAGRDGLAATAFAGLLIKPELVLAALVLLVWTRRWRAAAVLMTLGSFAVAASVLVVGPSHVLAYPRFVLENASTSANGTHVADMFGWNGLIGTAVTTNHPLVITLLVVPLSVAGLAAVFSALGHELPRESRRFAVAWVAITAATLLADPNLFFQDTVLLGPPVIFLFAHRDPHSRTTIAIAVALWTLSSLSYAFVTFHLNPLALLEVVTLVWSASTLRRRESTEPPPTRPDAPAHATR